MPSPCSLILPISAYFNHLNCFLKGEEILMAGLDPRIASTAKKWVYAWIFISLVMGDG